MSILLKIIYGFNTMPIKITMISLSLFFFTEIRKTYPEIYMESPGTLNNQNNPEKNEQSWKTHTY